MTRPTIRALLLGASLALLPRASRADAATEAKLREALRSTTQQLRALEDERAAWQGKEAALQKEVATFRAQPKAQPRSRASERELEELKAGLAEQTQAAARLQGSLERCEAERADAARSSDQERTRLTADSARLGEKLAAADAKNERMYRVGKEILDWLETQGKGGEPFLGLKRVQMENAAQDYQDKLIDQRTKPLGAP